MYQSSALILRHEQSGESDYLVTLFAERYGKFRAVAQGISRHGAKLQGHLELGSIADVSFVIGRNGYRLTSARFIGPGYMQMRSLEQRSALAAALTLIDENLMEDGASPELWMLVRDVTSRIALSRDEREAGMAYIWFAGRFLELLGLLPDINSPEGARARDVISLAAMPNPAPVRTPSLETFGHELASLGQMLSIPLRLPISVSGQRFRL